MPSPYEDYQFPHPEPDYMLMMRDAFSLHEKYLQDNRPHQEVDFERLTAENRELRNKIAVYEHILEKYIDEVKREKAEKVRTWQACRNHCGLCIQCGEPHTAESNRFWRCDSCRAKQRAYVAGKKHKL